MAEELPDDEICRVMEAISISDPAGPSSGYVDLPQDMSNPISSTLASMQLTPIQKSQKMLSDLLFLPFPQQKQQLLQICKANPQIMKALMKRRLIQLQQRPPQLQASNSQSLNKMIIARKSLPILQQKQQAFQSCKANLQIMKAFMKHRLNQPQQQTSNSQNSKKLITALKSPNNPQQQQVLQICKANPQIMKAFMKQPQQQTSNSHCLKKLITALKSPTSPQQQQQVLQILKANPQIMKAFTKYRLSQLQHLYSSKKK